MRKLTLTAVTVFLTVPFIAHTQTLQSVTDNGATSTHTVTVAGLNTPAFSLARPAALVDGGNILGGNISFVPSAIAVNNNGYLTLSYPDNASLRFGSDYDGHLTGTNTFREFQFGRSFDPYLFIKDGGKVSIGASDPISLFQVDDGCTKANIGDASGSGLNYGTSYIGFNAGRSGSAWTLHSDGGNNGGGVIYSDIFGNMNFAAVASTVSASDNVLSDADIRSKLYLQITKTGLVRAKAIKVETDNWPDYVFRAGYQLPPLAGVKTYIGQNHHLPDVPSEEELVKDGLNVGEMNKLLMKKVEELTLYLIEKDEQANDQQAQLQAQQKQLNELTKKLEALSKEQK